MSVPSGTAGVPFATRLSYGIGAAAYGVKDNGFAFFLLLYYNQVLGLPERWVGAAIMIALIVDAISDPIVGHLSDHLHSRWGRRHPFLYASVLPVAISYYFLWNPPADLPPTKLFAYLVVMAILVRTFITFYEIPSTALVPELTDRYDERTSLLGLRFFFGWWGGLSMSVIAYAILLQPTAEQAVGVLNPEGYRGYGAVAAGIMTAAILVSALGTHRHIPHLRQPPARSRSGWRGALRELRESLSNPSFLSLFLAAMFAALAAGLGSALNIYFATFYWELTSDQISVIVLGNFAAAALALGIAPALSRRLGKKGAAITTWVLALVLATVPVALRLAGWFPPNGSPWLLPALVLFSVIDVSFIITTGILVSSMVADVVEDSETTTGRRAEGVFFAARSFVAKSVSGLGVFLSTALLAFVGFPSNAKPGEVDPQIVWNLGAIYVPTLIALYTIALLCLSGYRISREGHEENLRRLGRAV